MKIVYYLYYIIRIFKVRFKFIRSVSKFIYKYMLLMFKRFYQVINKLHTENKFSCTIEIKKITIFVLIEKKKPRSCDG